MKIKTSFVTNSSSTSYIIIDSNKKPIDLYQSLNNWNNSDITEGIYLDIDELETFKHEEIEDFKIYNNYGKKLDWIQEIVGVHYGKMETKKAYNMALENLKKGKTVHYIILERSVNIDEFVRYENNLEIVYVGGY